MLINTSALIDDINKSKGLLFDKTLIAKHPFTVDVEEEMKGKAEEVEGDGEDEQSQSEI